MTETDLLTSEEFARFRRCSLRTLDRERAEGRGCPYIRLGSRILYRRADIDRYLDANRVGADRHVPDQRRGADAAPSGTHVVSKSAPCAPGGPLGIARDPLAATSGALSSITGLSTKTDAPRRRARPRKGREIRAVAL